MFSTLVSLVFPAVCVGCARELPKGALCAGCHKTLQTRPAPQCPHCDLRVPHGALGAQCRRVLHVSHIAVAYSYAHPMAKAAIDGLKYEYIRSLAEPLGIALAQALTMQWGAIPEEAIIVPVPLHPYRLRERGFNQSELLARHTSRALGIPLAPSGMLVRNRNTAQQVGLRRDMRKDNLIGAFTATGIDPAKAYILLDDVTTTGSTIREAARSLRSAGARHVRAATVAQG